MGKLITELRMTRFPIMEKLPRRSLGKLRNTSPHPRQFCIKNNANEFSRGYVFAGASFCSWELSSTRSHHALIIREANVGCFQKGFAMLHGSRACASRTHSPQAVQRAHTAIRYIRLLERAYRTRISVVPSKLSPLHFATGTRFAWVVLTPTPHTRSLGAASARYIPIGESSKETKRVVRCNSTYIRVDNLKISFDRKI